jgi:shikimate dehydrogenase
MQKYGLLGQKLSHSYSPAIHANFGDYSYELFEVEPENLAAFMQSGEFAGLNVTIPYKQSVMEFCTELSPTAQKIGSVNTIVRRPDNTLYGHNTDAEGFLKMLKKLGVDIRSKKIIIFGSHGSSLSVQYIFKNMGIGEIVVVAIEDNNPEFLSRHKDAQALVNCTPVGMYPNVGKSAVQLDNFPALEAVYDVVYNPARTQLLLDAEERGIPNIGGLLMLVGQAAVSSGYFTGQKISDAKINSTLSLLRRSMENIILIGMPGSGKSTHARFIAEKLKKQVVDTDEEIVKLAGKSIPEIFAQEGEDFFREKETAVLAKYGKESGLVIATGGGVITREENYAHLHQNGIIIYTEREVEALARNDRPLSQGDLHKLYETRQPMYRRFADKTVDGNDTPKNVSEKILEAVDEIYSN